MSHIDDMPAGADLDRLVGEKVMGWKFVRSYRPLLHGWIYEDGCGSMATPARIRRDWRPSTEIRQAWMVVERIRRLRCFSPLMEEAEFRAATENQTDEEMENDAWVWPMLAITCRVRDDRETPGDYLCQIYHGQDMDTDDLLAEAQGSTAPLAICRASLKAVANSGR